jgi:hypothetical protein
MKKEHISGGLADHKTIYDLLQKHYPDGYSKEQKKALLHQLEMGKKVEMEHTNDIKIAAEITKDHLSEDPKYYNKLKKIEARESIDASSSGSFEAPIGNTVITKPIGMIPNFKSKNKDTEIKEVTDASSSGAYDAPFPGFGRKDPLSIGGPETIHQRMNTIKAKKFPMWVKGGSFVEVKPKCKKFPYCNQGDIHALNFYRGTISEIANKYGITKSEIISIIIENIDIY